MRCLHSNPVLHRIQLPRRANITDPLIKRIPVMKHSHHTALFALVAITAIAAIGLIMYGSPQTGLIPQGSRYLSDSVGIGQDVHLRAAEICYPHRKKYSRYSTCCSQPCIDECSNAKAADLGACQQTCQNWCVKAVTQVYLERPLGFVGAFSKGMKKQEYVLYNK